MEEFELLYTLDSDKEGNIIVDFKEKNISLENRFASVELTASLLYQTYKSMEDRKILNEESEKKFKDALDVLIWMRNNLDGFLKERNNVLNDLGENFDKNDKDSE